MSYFETDLSKAIMLCNGDFTHYTDFSKIYSFTTENISGYLKYFDLRNKSLMTVGSSGDQILNAYFKGARDITLYDINIYAKYYVYLKIAAILCLDYNEFQTFFFKYGVFSYNNTLMFSIDIFNKLKDTLKLFDYESFLFFDELFNLFEPKRVREYLFDDDEARIKIIKSYNIYLRNENTYNILKSQLKSINFNYINGNIFNDDIPNKYDNIFLSNLCTVTSLEKFKKLLEKLDSNNLNKNGSILLGYLWYCDFNSDTYKENWLDIYKMPITRDFLKEYITEYHSIKSDYDFLWNKDKINDLVMVYRKK